MEFKKKFEIHALKYTFIVKLIILNIFNWWS